jgi:hypothetical protein
MMKNAGADKTYTLRVFTYKLNCILIVSMLLTFASTSEVTASSAASVSPDQGLFQRLIKIKYSSELYLIIKSKEAAKLNKPEMLDSALAVYNTIRWNLDGLVYQLSGDLVAANSPKKYKRINQWCLNNKAAVTSAAAAKTLESIESLCALYLPAFSLISETSEINSQKLDNNLSESSLQNRNINLTTNVFYLIKDSYSLIKGLSDLKMQKTMALVDILDQMRLTSPQELLKQVK